MIKLREVRLMEIVVILGIILAITIPAWERSANRQREEAAQQTEPEFGLMEEAEAAQRAEEAAGRPTTPEIVKVAAFIGMAVLVPTLMFREWLRQRRRRK